MVKEGTRRYKEIQDKINMYMLQLVMACYFFMRMSVQLGLSLQNLNMPKVLIQKPELNITHCDGSQWALSRGTGTGTTRFRVKCILKAAAGLG